MCTNPIYCKIVELPRKYDLDDNSKFEKKIIPLTREELSDFYLNKEKNLRNSYLYYTLPCRKCIECLVQNSKEWTLRCMYESYLYKNNTFITLTYNEYFNIDDNLHYEHVQNFLKRLRKKFKDKKIRYFGCAEYGSKMKRPHYHLILFNFDFDDKKFFKRTKKNEIIYRSKTLEDLWPFGFSSIGSVNENSIKYCSKYLQKFNLKDNNTINSITGEIINKRNSFIFMSLKPGIGLEYFKKIYKNTDYLYLNGKRYEIPDYFLKFVDDEIFWRIKSKRKIVSALAYHNVEQNEERKIIYKKRLQLFAK